MNRSTAKGLVCLLVAGLLAAAAAGGTEGFLPSGQAVTASAGGASLQPQVAGVLGGVDLAGLENGRTVGTGNGHIHIIPALSAKSVKNGDRVLIQAVVKALDGVAGVKARIEREEDGMPSWGMDGLLGLPADTLELAGAPLNAGGVNAAGTAGLWQAEWSASGLEEGYYRVAVTVTDKAGLTFTDRSLRFTDPIGGNNVIGSATYPNGGMRRLDKATATANLFRCATGDTTTGYAYFGTDTSPGTIVKVAMGAGSTPPAQVATLTLPAGDNQLSSVIIDTANSYAYFGTYTRPGRVIKVALGAGAAAPTRIGAATLPLDEDYLTCATGNPATGYALFGTDTSPGRVVKVAVGVGAAAPSRAGAAILLAGESNLRSAVSDMAEGYAYFGTNTSPGRVVKVLIGAGAAAPSWTASLTLPAGDDMLTSAVADAVSNYAYFGTGTALGRVVKVALGTGSAAPTLVGALVLNTGEGPLTSARLDLAAGHVYFGTGTSPGTVVKVALGAGAALPTRIAALTLNSGENNLNGMLIDTSAGFIYLGTGTSPGAFVRAGLSQRGFLKATKFTLAENGGVGSVSLYSHAAAGSVRLAIYDNSPNPSLVWESASTYNSVENAWLNVPIAAGTPSSLLLTPGDYWLGWQADVVTPMTSWAAGVSGNGLLVPMAYGACPSALTAGTGTAPILTDERWSEYITYWAPPAAASNPGATSVTRNAITWTWTDNSTDETGFQVYDDPDPVNPPTTLQAITGVNAVSWTHNGLASNTLYSFRTCATNLYGNSALTSIYTAWTLASAPSAPFVDNATLNTLDVAIGADINPAITLYAITISPAVGANIWVQADGTLGTNAVNRTAAQWGTTKVTGLIPATTYSFRVRAKNNANVNTAPGPAGTGTTLAAVPAAPTVGDAYVHSLDLTLNADANSASAIYAIQVSPPVGGNAWVQTGGNLGASPAYQTRALWGTKRVTGLAASTNYTFEVIARNAAGMTTAFGPPGAGATLAVLAITGNPAGGSAYVGDSFPLGVVASGGRAPLTYQWQKDGTDIPTATLETLSVSPAALADSGTYTCRVRDAGTENVLSGGAVLAVAEHVLITAPPEGNSAYAGDPFGFAVGVSGGIGTLTYQWYKDGAEIAGATLDTLSFSGLVLEDTAAYSCRVRDARTDNVLSPEGVLTVANHVSITAPPLSASAYLGGTHAFTIGASGGIGALTYQWYKDGVEIPDATLETLELTNLVAEDAVAYSCRVRDARTDDVGSADAMLALADHVSITTPPVGGVAYVGDPFDFAIGASGGIGTLTYQWYKDGAEIPGETLDTLSFADLVTGDTAVYSCRVRDALTDDVLSTEAALAVADHVSITAPPAGGPAYTGDAYTFTVGVSGGIGTLTYQWYKDGVEIPDATLDTLELASLAAEDAAAYSCRVRDAVTDDVLSSDAVLTVTDHISITTPPAGGSLYMGDPFDFTVAVSGGIGTLTYQWYKDGVEIPDATLDTLSFPGLVTGDTAAYSCRVRDAVTDDVLSADAALTVADHVSITAPPTGGPAYTGAAYTFAVGTSGGIGTLTYQWYKGGVEIPDATLDTLELASLVAEDAAAYSCRVRDAVTDDVLSPEAVLTVADHVSITTPPAGGSAYVGEPFGFTVVAAGGIGTLNYQWYKDGVEVPDAMSDTLDLADVLAEDAAAYSCRVRDALTDEVLSSDAVLAVADRISIAAQPEDQIVVKGARVAFAVEAAGGFAPLHYRWMKDGATLPGGPDASELVIDNAAFGDSGGYSAEVYDSHTDSTVSDTATLKVVKGVPAAGVLGLAALALAAALGGARALRRK